MSTKPTIETFDPTNPQTRGAQGAAGNFLEGMFQGQNPFAGMASPLQQQAINSMSGMLGQTSPEEQVFQMLQGPLAGMATQGMQNPFGDMGAFNQGQQVNQAAQSLFQQNLARAQGDLMSAAPGRFSSALAQQGADLGSQALRDFNMFQQQNLMQGLGLQNQQQQAHLNFLLGSGQQQLGAAGMLGQLGGQAGMAPFQRAMGAGQMATDMFSAQANPLTQLMMGGMQWTQPQAQMPVIRPPGMNIGQGAMGALGGAAAGAKLGSIFGVPGAAIGGGIGLLGGLFG
jgi:hypothetical protein